MKFSLNCGKGENYKNKVMVWGEGDKGVRTM